MGIGGNGNAAGGRRVAFLTRHGWPWQRQMDDGAGHHQGVTFNFAAGPDDDWLVVYDDIRVPVMTRVPARRRILIVTEPPGQKRYAPQFANQFGILVSPYALKGYRGERIAQQPGINWFYGVDFDSGKPVSRIGLEGLRNLPVPPDKQKRISVVCSSKSRLPGHRARLALLERLRASFGASIDVYGRGFRPIGDKADAIAPYRYHLVLENNACPHFWTEKIADPYLGYSLPIFAGCANITDYFPERSLVRIPDVHDLDAAVRVVGDVLAQDPWADRLDAIRAARSALIERHNLFSVLVRLTAADVQPGRLAQDEVILPGSECGPLRSLFRPVRQLFAGAR
jgi:hypothetical protein